MAHRDGGADWCPTSRAIRRLPSGVGGRVWTERSATERASRSRTTEDQEGCVVYAFQDPLWYRRYTVDSSWRTGWAYSPCWRRGEWR